MCFSLEDGVLALWFLAGPLGSHFHFIFGLSLAILIGGVIEDGDIINLIMGSSLFISVPGCTLFAFAKTLFFVVVDGGVG